jgi:hypothetical protein
MKINGKDCVMQDNEQQRKNPRGSSPQMDRFEGSHHAIPGPASDRQVPAYSWTPSGVFDLRVSRTRPLKLRTSNPLPQPEEEGRWQDDGGECG